MGIATQSKPLEQMELHNQEQETDADQAKVVWCCLRLKGWVMEVLRFCLSGRCSLPIRVLRGVTSFVAYK